MNNCKISAPPVCYGKAEKSITEIIISTRLAPQTTHQYRSTSWIFVPFISRSGKYTDTTTFLFRKWNVKILFGFFLHVITIQKSRWLNALRKFALFFNHFSYVILNYPYSHVSVHTLCHPYAFVCYWFNKECFTRFKLRSLIVL